MLKLVDVFILSGFSSFSFFPSKTVDYDADVKEIERRLAMGVLLDVENLAHDKSNIYADLSKAFNALTHEHETIEK